MKLAHASRRPLPKADPSWRIGIIHAGFYPDDVAGLIASAKDALLGAGVTPEHISLHPVSGSFEIPLVGAALARSGAVDGLIGLGIIVEGETYHAELIAQECARGMMEVQLRHGVPFGFEVLYVDTLELARARLGNGEEAARAVLQSLATLSAMRSERIE